MVLTLADLRSGWCSCMGSPACSPGRHRALCRGALCPARPAAGTAATISQSRRCDSIAGAQDQDRGLTWGSVTARGPTGKAVRPLASPAASKECRLVGRTLCRSASQSSTTSLASLRSARSVPEHRLQLLEIASACQDSRRMLVLAHACTARPGAAGVGRQLPSSCSACWPQPRAPCSPSGQRLCPEQDPRRAPEGEQDGVPLQASKARAQHGQALHDARQGVAGHQVQLRLAGLMVPAGGSAAQRAQSAPCQAAACCIGLLSAVRTSNPLPCTA